MDIRKYLRLNDLAAEDGKRFEKKRGLFETILTGRGRHFTGIVGPRGVGKTVILKQVAAHVPDCCYISCDTLENDDLFEIARILSTHYKIALLLLDEVHFQQEYDRILKSIFYFLTVRVVFTSSVSLSMFDSAYDLSRRVRLEHLYPFSYREFLYFRYSIEVPPLSLARIVRNDHTPEHLRYGSYFGEYVQGGLMPFHLEEPDIFPLLHNILQTIITRDIPSTGRLAVEDLTLIEKTVKFIGRSGIDGINYSSLSKNVGITKYKAEKYVRLLRDAFVLNPVYPSGSNVLREPKVCMCLPYRLLYREFAEVIGPLREDFFVECMRMRGIDVHYLKSTRGAKTPDYLIPTDNGPIVVEIGGKGKGREQFKGIAVDTKIVLSDSAAGGGAGGRRPLVFAGYV